MYQCNLSLRKFLRRIEFFQLDVARRAERARGVLLRAEALPRAGLRRVRVRHQASHVGADGVVGWIGRILKMRRPHLNLTVHCWSVLTYFKSSFFFSSSVYFWKTKTSKWPNFCRDVLKNWPIVFFCPTNLSRTLFLHLPWNSQSFVESWFDRMGT